MKRSLLPIIGVNESGKTTILHAIFAFDPLNDEMNNGEHLLDIHDLNSLEPMPPRVTAEIELTPEDFGLALSQVIDASHENPETAAAIDEAEARYLTTFRDMAETLTVSRNLETLEFSIVDHELFDAPIINDLIADHLLRRLPYILFFDDFRDAVPDEIEIKRDQSGAEADWLDTVNNLFTKALATLSVFDIIAVDERTRDSAMAQVNRLLNKTLSEEWQHYRLDNSEMIEIELVYSKDRDSMGDDRHLLKFRIAERDAKGNLHYFYVRNRSKGFFWFFNFVMKLEFNPKVTEWGSAPIIFLLDEPGSYLHGAAQSKLCGKLRMISNVSTVIYCTHSHHLLDPKSILPSSIMVADKDNMGIVDLVSISKFRATTNEQRLAFQPVMEALEIRPFQFDLSLRNVVMVEGIIDFYAFEMFKTSDSLSFLPAVNADSVIDNVPYMLAWGLDFRALWDNDDEGIQKLEQATAAFDEEIAQKHFRILSLVGSGRKRKLQDLFDGDDMRMMRTELGLARNSSFDRTIRSLFYSLDRERIIESLTGRTEQNFRDVIDSLGLAALAESADEAG
jgi:hypothetical protein